MPRSRRALRRIASWFHSSDGPDRLAIDDILSIAERRPLDINVETTSFCALSCAFCPNKTNRRKKALMDMEAFIRICDEYDELGGGAIGLSSMQSDVFADDLLMERLRSLEKYRDRFWVHTTTNLVGARKLSDREMAAFLEGFDYVEVSIGGPDKDAYREMFGVDALDSVVEQLSRMSRMLKSSKIETRVAVGVRTNDRKKFLESDLYENLSNDSALEFSSVMDEFFSWGGLVSQDQLPGGATLLEPLNDDQRTDCVVPWASLSINVDGSVVGCGCVDWNAQHVVGNVFSHSIAEVWNSEEARKFRTAFSANAIPDLCRKCSLYTPIDAGFGRKALRSYRPTDGLYYTV